jgi:glycosyltransferase involved in cell wall biosynthesis
VRRLAGFKILHLHWVFQFSLPWARQAGWARRAAQLWFAFYLRAASFLGYALVWTAHDLLPHKPVFADDDHAHRDLAERADLVIALSEATAAELSERGARELRLVPLGAYAEPELSEVARQQARSALGWQPGECVVVHLGKILPYKGADILLEAAKLVPAESPVRVVVVGACADPQHGELLRRLCGDLGTRAELRLQRIDDEEMAMYLAGADLAAFPFREVTNSSSLLNAQCHALPAVIPDLASLRDVPGAAVLRYDGSLHGLAQMISRFAQLPTDERKRMGEAARSWATSADWPTIAEMTVHVYKEAMSARRAARGRL